MSVKVEKTENKNEVKLEFTIENCIVDSRYQVMVEFINTVVEPFFTETVRAQYNTLTFNTCYICDYFFEKPQLMRITILKNGNQFGRSFLRKKFIYYPKTRW